MGSELQGIILVCSGSVRGRSVKPQNGNTAVELEENLQHLKSYS